MTNDDLIDFPELIIYDQLITQMVMESSDMRYMSMIIYSEIKYT